MGFLFLLASLFGLTGGGPLPAEHEDSVYVYEVFRDRPDCSELVARLKALPLRSTVILSVEQGSSFILDRPRGEDDLACALEYLRSTSRKAKALLLQDPVFLERGEEAVRRAALLGAFAAQHKDYLSGAQVDVEPHTIENWGCYSVEERRALMRDLHQLLARVRRNLGGLPLGVVAPWWYPVARELPEASPQSLFEVADEIYLMAYGDEGGPLVGGTAERVLSRVDAPEFFSGNGRMYVALAAYEFRSPEHFQEELEIVRRRLAARPTFAGTVLFHATSRYNVPLGRFLAGTVTDPEGRGLAGAELEAEGVKGKTNACGQFSLRLPDPKTELIVRKQGSVEKRIRTELPSGAVRELGSIVLEREKAEAR